jgi:hypothetical protein
MRASGDGVLARARLVSGFSFAGEEPARFLGGALDNAVPFFGAEAPGAPWFIYPARRDDAEMVWALTSARFRATGTGFFRGGSASPGRAASALPVNILCRPNPLSLEC